MDKAMTSLEICALIKSEKVNEEMGAKLIENYGLRRLREYRDVVNKEANDILIEFEQRMIVINKKMDELLNKTVEVYKK